MNSQMFFLTLIIIMWDSSRISKKWGFSTDKLMLGTARKHKRKFSLFLDIMKCRQEHKNIFHLHLGLIWSSMFHWELGVSFKYGLQVTSTCSQPLNRNKNMPFLTFCTQNPSAMNKVGEVRAETCFTTLAASCQRSKAHIRWLGAESGLCYAEPSQGHPSDLHTPPPATGRWCHLCHSKNRQNREMWHSIEIWYISGRFALWTYSQCHSLWPGSVSWWQEPHGGDCEGYGLSWKDKKKLH